MTAPEQVAEVITVTIRTDDPFAAEHLKHLLEAEGYDADITVTSDTAPAPEANALAGDTCGQCGQPFGVLACGFSHIAVASERGLYGDPDPRST